ncbi:MAG: peptidylprolyl isomerase, partial [Dehalococcoidia bacterium]|nr:peptidylprolyl isomerase [Dehalococcoidia bacterium]
MVRNYPAADFVIEPDFELYTATISTSRGDIVIELFVDAAPNTVNSFVFLAENRFFDGLVFHRVVENFVVQGGDPLGTGRGGPGYITGDEPNEIRNETG